MIDPENALKKWALDTMKANAALVALVPAERILSYLPEGSALPQSPYIVLGPWTATGEDAACFEGMLVNMVINAYTVPGGPNGGDAGEHGSGALTGRISAAIRRALKTDDAGLPDDATAAISHRVTRHFPLNGGICMSSVNMEATFDQFE